MQKSKSNYLRLKNEIPLSEKATYSVDESAAILGICRQGIYNEINANRLRSFKAGKRRLIPSEAIAEWKATMIANS